MSGENFEASWERTRGHLAAGAAAIDAECEGIVKHSRFGEYLDHNELELALDELEAAAGSQPHSPAAWAHLHEAAKEMLLSSRVNELRYRIAGATWGYYEALLSLRPTEDGWRTPSLKTGFRCPWDIGALHEGKATLNDAAIVLIQDSLMTPGESGRVLLHPLVPELWGRHLVGQVIRPWDGGFFGEAMVSGAVPPWAGE